MEREEEILGGALEFDDQAERRAFVRGACGSDEDLLKRVERLLAAFSGAEEEEFIAGPLADREAPIREGEGAVIGRYKLLQKIGEGGFGVVYMAEQKEPVKRRVALKIIKLGMDTKQVVGRFEAERQALAMMDHPNIAKVLDAGATASGRPYFVMDLVRGVPLMQFCDEHTLSTRARLNLYLDICGAIAHAHQKGIIHRDLKPSNVIVTLHNDRPMPKVIDFGIAKATQQELTDITLFTRYEDFVGTPAYMSPEQAQYSGLDIDTRTDVYSLGVMLYEMLTGGPPFNSRDLLKNGLDELRRRLREDEPNRPSTKVNSMEAALVTQVASSRRTNAAQLSKMLRGELDWIVLKAMEKDRQRRYPSASALASDIQRHLRGEVVEACPPSAVYRLKKFARKNRTAMGIAAGVMLALSVGAIVSAWQAVRASQAEREATHQMWNAYLHQASLSRQSGVEGQRDRSLAIVAQAAAIKPAVALRNEALASMVLPDFRLRERFQEREFDADGEVGAVGAGLLLRGDEKGKVKVFNRSSGVLLRELPPHGGGIRGFRFSPNERYFVVRYRDGESGARSLSIWAVDGEQPVVDLVGTHGLVSFTADGLRAVIGRADQSCAIYALSTGELEGELSLPYLPDRALLSPDQTQMAVCHNRSETALVLDCATGSPVAELRHGRRVHELAWSEDGRQLVTGTAGFNAYLWDVATETELQVFRGHTAEVVFADFHPTGRFLFTGAWDGSTRVWDPRNGNALLRKEGTAQRISSDGARLHLPLSSNPSGAWEFIAGPAWFSHFHLAGETKDKHVTLSFSPDSQWLAGAARRGVAVWDLAQQQRIAFGAKMETYHRRISFEPGGTGLLVAGTQSIRRHSLRSTVNALGEKELEFQGGDTLFRGRVRRFDVSEDGMTMAVIEETGKVRLLERDSGVERAVLEGRPEMTELDFSPDGRWLAADCWPRGGVRVWDLAHVDGAPVDLIEQEPRVRAQFSPDGQWLVLNTYREGIQFLRVGTWEVEKVIATEGMYSVIDFDPKGRFIVVSLDSEAIQLLDYRSHEVICALRTPKPSSWWSACVSPDGSKIAATTNLRDVYVWDLPGMRSDLAAMGLDWNWAK